MFEYWTTNKNLDIEFNVEHVNERILNIEYATEIIEYPCLWEIEVKDSSGFSLF